MYHNDICPMCEEGVKDEKHIFMTCPHAVAIWQHVGLSVEVSSAIQGTLDFNASFFNLLETLAVHKRNTFMMFWVIWKEGMRNCGNG